jgi:flagellar M-ring protein FliF
VTELPQRLSDIWSGLSATRKALLALTGGALVAMAVVLYSWSATPSYVALFSGMAPEDSSAIVDQLRSRGVPFEVDHGGGTVRVPENEVDQLRLDLAAQGLPAGGGVGFELFDGNSFTATDFVQRLNFQRGLQGELARTIRTFTAVEDARVHVVLPERALFTDDERPPTASVVLRMRSNRRLDDSEVRAVVHLVTGSVEGLEREHLTVVDTSGAVLFDGASSADDTGIGLTSTQFELQRSYESALERDAQRMLESALGPGRSAVQVQATLDFDRLETETETFTPGQEGGVPRSTTTLQETFNSAGDTTTGTVPGAFANVPGADTNLPAGAVGGTGNSSDYTRSETVSNFEVGRTVTRSVDAPGEVERLSVSLLLDEAVAADRVPALQAAVSAAVGLDEARGDVIAVQSLLFDRTRFEDAAAAFDSEASASQILTYARIGLPIALLVVAFIFFRLLLRSVSRRMVVREIGPAELAQAGAYGALAAPGAAGIGNIQAQLARTGAPAGSLPSIDDQRSEMEQQVSKIAKDHPDTVAGVVQSWMRED